MSIKFELEENFSLDDFYIDETGDRKLKPVLCDKRNEEIECGQCEFYNEIEDICEFKILNKVRIND